ncbi:MAG: pyridoxal phosphate-dependent aminotransferase, partial [Actinomycetota bacterium]
AWAQEGPVIRLEVGQPDRIPPRHILQAMADSVLAGETGYTPNAGIPELREACAAKLGRVNRIPVDPDQVLITAGSMQGLSAVMLGLTETGDEILVPDPGWPNYAMAARIARAIPVTYPLAAEDGYLPDPDRIESAIGDRTRMLVVNSPSNPLGTVIDGDRMGALAELAERHDLWLVSDECYDQIVFSGEVAPSAAATHPDRVVSVHSFSKTYAMTGLRVAYVSGPEAVVATLTKMQEALVACVNGPAQKAAVAALEGPQDFIADMRDTYRARRDRAVTTADRLGLPHLHPEGAFYLWLPLGRRIGDPMGFCRRLVTEQGVAVAPGSTFGRQGEGAVRVSLAAAEPDITEGLDRIARVL